MVPLKHEFGVQVHPKGCFLIVKSYQEKNTMSRTHDLFNLDYLTTKRHLELLWDMLPTRFMHAWSLEALLKDSIWQNM